MTRRWGIAVFVVLASLGLAQPKIVQTRSLGDHVEVDLALEQPAPLQVAASTCLAQLVPQSDTAFTLSLIHRGFNACTVDLKVGENDLYRLSVSAPGESGFNVILSGTGQFGPAGANTYGAKLGLSGGYADLHLNGEMSYNPSSPLDGRLRLRYQDTQLDWAGVAGIPGHPAGDTGPGFYAAQNLWMFTLAAATPLGSPPRVGLGLNFSNVCFGGNMSIQAKDPILWVSGGAEGFSLRVQYQPKRLTFLDYEGEYRSTPEFHLHFGGSEVAGYAEVWGLLSDSDGWLKYQLKASLDAPGFSSDGALDSPDFHLDYNLNPTNGALVSGYYRFGLDSLLSEIRLGGQYASAGPSYGSLDTLWSWDESFGSVLGVRVGNLGTGGKIGLSYQTDLSGVFQVSAGLEADNIALRETFKASAGLAFKSLEGFAISLEATTPFGQTGDSVVKVKAAQWFFAPVDAPPVTAQWVDPKEPPSLVEPNFCWRWR
jgi:hypothetical protein